MTALALGLGHDGHVTELAIDRLLYDPPGSPGLSALQSHIATCLVCKRRVSGAREADASVSLAPPAGLGWLGHLTELAIDRIVLNETDKDLRIARLHLETCARCAAEVASAQEWDASVQLSPPAAARPVSQAATSAETSNGTSAQTPAEAPAETSANVVSMERYRAARRWLAPVAAALAASLAFAVLSVGPDDGYDDGVRLKGSTFGVAFFVHDGAAVRRVDTGDAVRPGERIGFRLRMPEPGHVMIVGVDSTGSVYACHPQDTDGNSRAYKASADPIRIDEAMRFDDSAGHERLIAITCQQPFSLDDVRERMSREARALDASDPMPVVLSECVQRETVLTKVSATASATDGGAR